MNDSSCALRKRKIPSFQRKIINVCIVVVYYLPFKDMKDSVVADDEFGRVIFAAWDIVGCSCAAP